MTKVYKGQTLVVDGSGCGEFPAITKLSYNSSMAIEYIGECKQGLQDSVSRHYIEKFIYDSSLSLTRILVAQNKIIANATAVTIEVLTAHKMRIILPTDGDFSEVNTGDAIYVNTATNSINNIPVVKIADDELMLMIDTSGFTSETATPISTTDIQCELLHDSTKDFNKRRWDFRTRYIYG